MPTLRSSSNKMLARIKGGKPNTIISPMPRMYQQNMGMVPKVIPLVRLRKIDATSSIPADKAEISTKVTPNNQTSEPGPGAEVELLSGVYINQPERGGRP